MDTTPSDAAPVALDGRKRHGACALFDSAGRLLATSQALWIEVYVPHGLSPGTYDGAVALRSGGGLRRVPVDPTTGSDDWGLRAYQDKPDSTSWSGQNVYDVYSKNQGTGLDGTKYRDWN